MIDQPLHAARILLVEDDYWQASDGRERLTSAGAKVVVMTGALPAALEIIRTTEIDIGLLDINLGEGQSFDVARALLAKGVPVLFLTGYEATFLPPDLKAVSVITKPAAWQDVISRLAALLGTCLGATSE